MTKYATNDQCICDASQILFISVNNSIIDNILQTTSNQSQMITSNQRQHFHAGIENQCDRTTI